MPRKTATPVNAFRNSWNKYHVEELRPITESVLNFIQDGDPIPADVLSEYNADLIEAKKEHLQSVVEQARAKLAELENQ